MTSTTANLTLWRKVLVLCTMIVAGLVATSVAQAEGRSVEELMHEKALDVLEQAMLAGPSAKAVNAPLATSLPATKMTGFNCLPTCDEDDGKFFAIAGTGTVTLSDPILDLVLAVPAGTTTFSVGVFDGDGAELDVNGVSRWDQGPPILYTYELFQDPDGSGTILTPIELQPGVFVVNSDTLSNDAWDDFPVATAGAVPTPSGNIFYRLRVSLAGPAVTTLNAFKVRTDGIVTIETTDQPFSYIATGLLSQPDVETIYPAFPANTPTSYDGTFVFHMEVALPQTVLQFWDGDFDKGDFNGVNNDTDDLNTPGAPFKPAFATPDALFEDVATGAAPSTGQPPDDIEAAGPTAFFLRSPSVRYDLVSPDGDIYSEENPSGNQEWETFVVTTEPFDPALHDTTSTDLPAGIYRLVVEGVDLLNLNAIRLPFRLLCVDEMGDPCESLRPYLVGDRVFEDLGTVGVEDPGDPGIAGVVVNLLDMNGDFVEFTTTDTSGAYTFEVDSGDYTVEIDASNFDPGGALESMVNSTGSESIMGTVVTDNVLTFDFGYINAGSGSIGDFVWYDGNQDTIQNDGPTPGLASVTVHLCSGLQVSCSPLDPSFLSSQVTDPNGGYLFIGLPTGDYTVDVDDPTLPTGSFSTTSNDPLTVNLAPDENLLTADFGYAVFYPEGLATIGDTVWEDANANGLFDFLPVAENGLDGVTVTLEGDIDADGIAEIMQSTVTGFGFGFYQYVNLPAGTYTVSVDAGTLPPAINNPTFDADGIATPNTATVFLLVPPPPQFLDTVDFGYNSPVVDDAALGDFVWFDVNGDGVQDAGEPGIAGVTVNLLDDVGGFLQSAVTDASGLYSFTDLAAGDYQVEVVTSSLPAGSVETFDLDGTGTPSITAVTLAQSEVNNDVDFGYRGDASLGDRVWLDLDGDGVQDAGEPGIAGVTVTLTDAGGNTIGTDTTDGSGNYGFADLLSGAYTVTVDAGTLPAGVNPTFDLDGTGTANTTAVTLAAGEAKTDVDFGYNGNAALGDRVVLDLDSSGSEDPGEPGIAGVTIELVDGGGNVIATDTTDANGNYGFANLPAGTFTVRVVAATLPTGVSQTFDLDATLDGETTVTLAAGEMRDDADFGYVGSASIGDLVFVDLDGDGVQDVGENGIAGVTVTLTDGGGNTIASAVTDANGLYGFSGLPAGSYTVTVDAGTLPAGANPASDRDGVLDNQTQVTLAAGQAIDDADFGYNGNGAEDIGEPGIPGVTMELRDGGGNVVATTTTDANGNYSFGNLLPGTYTVAVVASSLPTGASQTFDLDAVLDNQTTVTLAAGEARDDLDFGYLGDGSVGDTVFEDRDGDQTQGGSEPGIAGVTVELLDGGGNVIATDTTDANGNYGFGSLLPGSYTVRVTRPAGYDPTVDRDGTLDDETTVSLTAGQAIDDADFGYRGTGSIGDRVWEDTNGDGDQAGESGLNGVTVDLLDGGGIVIATAVTSGDGNYTFPNLPPGDYTVVVDGATVPAGATQTGDRDGVQDNQTSVTLGPGQTIDDADFGYQLPVVDQGVIGDRVWLDTDGDGVQDGGEPGLNSFLVLLRDNANAIIDTAITTNDGTYLFSDLPAGTYTVEIDASTLLPGIVQTFDFDGLGTPNSATVTIGGGETNLDLDFGYNGDTEICVSAAEAQEPYADPSSAGHAIWLPGIGLDFVFDPDPGTALIFDNGTSSITGTVRRVSNPSQAFTVDFQLSGYQSTPPAGSPKLELDPSAYAPVGPVDPATWWYYTSLSGTLTGIDAFAGAELSISRAGSALQVGFGANGKNLNLGLSSWFSWTVVSQPSSGGSLQSTGEGDINVDIVECPVCVPSIDFDDFATGQVIDDELASLGIHVTTDNPGSNPAMIFDSANPTGGDYDLGTPNTDFGGPGLGSGGSAGAAGENAVALGKVLIISEDGDSSDPDDKASGGDLIFTFDNPVDVDAVDILDIDDGMGGRVKAFDAADNIVRDVAMQDLGNNSVQTVVLNATGVSKLVVWFPGSGAVSAIYFDCDGPDPCTPGNVRDDFDQVSFSNNDGSFDWAGDWIEDDVAGSGPSSGNVTIDNGFAFLKDRPNTGTHPSLARQVDLTGADTATLSFKFDTSSYVDYSDEVTVEVSNDGGTTWSTLEVITGISGSVTQTRSFDITGFISAQTQVRFRVSKYYGGSNEFFCLQWVDISWTCPNGGGGGGGNPPQNLHETNLSAWQGEALQFSLDVQAGSSTVSFNITGGSGDADLYVRYGSEPTLTSFDCRPWMWGNEETCTFQAPAAGTYHVMVHAYEDFSGVTLTSAVD